MCVGKDNDAVLSLGARAAIAFIRFYQLLKPKWLQVCRFDPTCSSYGLEAYQKHGFWKGTSLTVRRIARCNPWGGEGDDPVPEPDGNESGVDGR